MGKEVITHTDSISVPGWSGAGYVIYDPEMGSGAWKIGGGMNGSYSETALGEAGLGLLSLITSIGSFFAKAGVAFSAYLTALKDVGNLLTTYVTYSETGSLWKGLAAGAVDLGLTVLSGFVASTIFSSITVAASPVLAAIFVALSVAVLTSMIKGWIISNYIATNVFIKRYLLVYRTFSSSAETGGVLNCESYVRS